MKNDVMPFFILRPALLCGSLPASSAEVVTRGTEMFGNGPGTTFGLARVCPGKQNR